MDERVAFDDGEGKISERQREWSMFGFCILMMGMCMRRYRCNALRYLKNVALCWDEKE